MSLHTAFVDGAPALEVGSEARLQGRETRHLRAVRASPGDPLLVTDGRGGLWLGRLERCEGDEASCRLLEVRDPPPDLPVELAFGVGAKHRTLWLVEKAVELGARRLQPVEFARSRSVADAARSNGFWRKARRRAVHALKQCAGARLPRLEPVIGLSELLARAGPPGPGAPRLLMSAAAAAPAAAALGAWDGRTELGLLVGPEGGLEETETAVCERAGYRPVHLGPRALRFETAAVAAVAIVAQAAGRRPTDAPSPTATERRRR